MQKFYFNLLRGDAVYADTRGTRLSSVDRAFARGKSYAKAVMRDDPHNPRADQCIEIVSDDDVVLGMVPFENALA